MLNIITKWVLLLSRLGILRLYLKMLIVQTMNSSALGGVWKIADQFLCSLASLKFSKKVVCNCLCSFLETHNILSGAQFSFRPGHSTIHLMLHFMNNKEHTTAIFRDLHVHCLAALAPLWLCLNHYCTFGGGLKIAMLVPLPPANKLSRSLFTYLTYCTVVLMTKAGIKKWILLFTV